jgi:hypothetical protein
MHSRGGAAGNTYHASSIRRGIVGRSAEETYSRKIRAMLIALPHMTTADMCRLKECSARLRNKLDWDEDVSSVAWRSVQFTGPYPFGFRPCLTVFAESGVMIVPQLLETLAQRHGRRMRSIVCRDVLMNDVALACLVNFSRNLVAVDLSHSDHRLLPGQPAIPSVVTSASLSCLVHCTALTDLRLRHCNVSQWHGDCRAA